MGLSRRKLRVLAAIVETYIRTGVAVASRQVARGSRLGLSSATIRNVMAELEAAGLVSRSHVSAGCIPTDACLRVYIDCCGAGRGLSATTRRRLTARIASARRELVEDIEWIAQLVADETREAGVAIRPMGEEPRLEAVSLIPLDGLRILGVVVTVDGAVEKRVLKVTKEPTRQELQELASFLSTEFYGRTLTAIREWVDSAAGDEDDLTGPWSALDLALTRQLFTVDVEGAEVQVAGTDNLLQASDFAEVDRLRSVLEALHDRAQLFREWRRLFARGRTQVVIGRESEVTASGGLGMVATLFFREGRRAGAVGVVGPRRMDYGRIVPVVEFVGDTLTRMLEEGGARHA